MKKKILVVYSKMIVGGSTTSLLSLLNELDYNRYQVDLLLFEKGGILDNGIPSKVNILDNDFLHIKKKSFSYILSFVYAILKSKVAHNRLIRSQIMSKALAKSQPKLQEEYDCAIAFLEFWPSNFVHQNVKANKKILWLHFDYLGAKLDMRYDKKMYKEADAVITVSRECEKNLKSAFPKNNNVYTIQNILSSKTIKDLSNEYEPNENLYNAEKVFVTVARIDFNSKGLDRGVKVFREMKNLYPNKTFRWLIIGNGPDKLKLETMIIENHLENEVILLGELNNPHPYVRKADIFFLPSRYEGKPMSVTEAQMNGVVPFVTNYTSASGQIRHLEDGLICENNDESLTELMSCIFKGSVNIEVLRKNVINTEYSNLEEIKKIYKLLY